MKAKENKFLTEVPIRIPIKPIKQQGRDCLMTCLQMILEFYEYKIDRAELDEFFIKETVAFSINPELTDVAKFALKYGFTTDLHACNLFYSILKHNVSEDKVIKRLEILQKRAGNRKYKIQLESTLQALKAGTNYFVEIPNPKRIKEYLSQNIPVIVTVNYSALHDQSSEDLDTGHAVIISGLSGDKFYIIDPNHTAEELIDQNQVLFAINQDKPITTPGYLLAIKKLQ